MTAIHSIKKGIKAINLNHHIDRCINDGNSKQQFINIDIESENLGVCFEICLYINVDLCKGDRDTPASIVKIDIEKYEIMSKMFYKDGQEVQQFISEKELNEILPTV